MDSVAAMFGVSKHSVWRIASEKNSRLTSERQKARYTASCSKCGGPCVSAEHPSKRGVGRRTPVAICQSCEGKSRRIRFRYDELGQLAAVKCETCKAFKHPEEFCAGVKFKDIRPECIHKSCRACLTKLRQDYRERHKIPCRSCGAPCLPASEKGPRGADSRLCRSCWLESRKKAAA